MKLARGILAGIGLMGALYATAAYSAIAERQITKYYDANGALVGVYQIGCNSQPNMWGVVTDIETYETSSCGYPPWYDVPPLPWDWYN